MKIPIKSLITYISFLMHRNSYALSNSSTRTGIIYTIIGYTQANKDIINVDYTWLPSFCNKLNAFVNYGCEKPIINLYYNADNEVLYSDFLGVAR